MSRIDGLIGQIQKARRYTTGLLDATPGDDWFRMPAEGVSHVAWQVGHLALSEYRLGLHRLRGALPEDETLISSGFLARFGRASIPDPDPSSYPPAGEIRAVFDRVHDRVMAELAGLDDARLDEPILVPHSLFTRKGDALAWCPQHEMIHAGQIGLLRRLIGRPPIW